MRYVLACVFLASMFASAAVLNAAPLPQPGTVDYSFETHVSGQVTEWRLFKTRHHFASLINDNSVIILRCRSGHDPNGWGNSIYLGPYLVGGGSRLGEVDRVISTTTGIKIDLLGSVSSDAGNSDFGSYEMSLTLSFNDLTNEIAGTGNVSLELDGPLPTVGKNMVLARVATNWLRAVPLQYAGGVGDTGNNGPVHVDYNVGDGADFVWNGNPPQHYPVKPTDKLALAFEGMFNEVDTIALGLGWMAKVADKPGLNIEYTDLSGDNTVSFGGQFDTTKSQDPMADNVGCTFLVLKQNTAKTIHHFAVNLSAYPAWPTTHWGTPGNDTIEINITGQSNIVVTCLSGNDKVILRGTPSPNLKLAVYGGLGNDEIYCYHKSSGNHTLGFFSLGGGNDLFRGDRGTNKTIVLGEGGDDVLVGTDGTDVIFGGPGIDYIRGKSGNDILLGEDDLDRIYGEAGDDLIFGGEGNDSLDGGSGQDIILGENGNDLIDGGPHTDILLGGNQDDYITTYGGGLDYVFGESGNDTVTGGFDDGTGSTPFVFLSGGPGNDLLFVYRSGNYWYHGGAGTDNNYWGWAVVGETNTRWVPDLGDSYVTDWHFQQHGTKISAAQFNSGIQNALMKLIEKGIALPQY